MFARSFVRIFEELFPVPLKAVSEEDVERLKRKPIERNKSNHHASNLPIMVATKQAIQTKATV